jgi:hypothetical protein
MTPQSTSPRRGPQNERDRGTPELDAAGRLLLNQCREQVQDLSGSLRSHRSDLAAAPKRGGGFRSSCTKPSPGMEQDRGRGPALEVPGTCGGPVGSGFGIWDGGMSDERCFRNLFGRSGGPCVVRV